MVGKYHHSGVTVKEAFPFSSMLVLKNTILKSACGGDKLIVYARGSSTRTWGSSLTEMYVPGKKTIVTAAIVIIEELSCFVSNAILAVRSAMSRFVLLST